MEPAMKCPVCGAPIRFGEGSTCQKCLTFVCLSCWEAQACCRDADDEDETIAADHSDGPISMRWCMWCEEMDDSDQFRICGQCGVEMCASCIAKHAPTCSGQRPEF
jgi:hypothetical protein